VLDYFPKDIVVDVPCIGSPSMILAKILEAVAPIQDLHFKNPLSS
jgi:hypothetical protein